MGAADDFRALLAPGAIRAVFQPIVRLSDQATIGYEGLARFPTPPGLPPLPPDVMLAAGARYGLRDDLELACWSAIAGAGAPPHGRLLWVNLSPEALGHPGLLELAGRLPSRLVIELTEQDTVLNNGLLRERLRPWIARGALVAVDDAGAGFTSLEYVAEIRPDFLKLSRDMVAGVDRDATREAVLRATAAFAREVGARVVAEGVERAGGARGAAGDGHRLRPGLPVRPPGRGVAGGCAVRSVPRRAPRPPATARARRSRGRATRARRARPSPTTSRGAGLLPAVLPGVRRAAALPGGARVLAGLRRAVRERGHRRARVPDRRRRRSSPTSARRPTTCPTVPGVRAEVCVPLRGGRRGRRRARRRGADRDRRRRRSTRSTRCAELLSARLDTSAPTPVSPAQRLARVVDARGRRARGARRRAGALRLRVRPDRAHRRPRRALSAHRRRAVRGRVLAARRRASSRRWPPGSTRPTSSYTRRRHRGPRLQRPRGAAPRRRRDADRRAAHGRGRPARAARARRPREPPPGRRRRSSCSSCSGSTRRAPPGGTRSRAAVTRSSPPSTNSPSQLISPAPSTETTRPSKCGDLPLALDRLRPQAPGAADEPDA